MSNFLLILITILELANWVCKGDSLRRMLFKERSLYGSAVILERTHHIFA
jgi:hypothetical protein